MLRKSVDSFVVLSEGARFARVSLKRRGDGYKRYAGNPVAISEQIVKDCFNGTHFQGSCGHFTNFWARDMGMCAESLLRTGFEKELRASLKWALNIYSRNKKITTTIFKEKYPIDIYAYASDSLPFLLHALIVSGMKDEILLYKDFLNGEIKRYAGLLFDFKTGLVKRRLYISGAKDCVRRDSSMYDNTMVAWLADMIEKCGALENPWNGMKLKENIRQNFWKENYFLEDLSGATWVSSDANVWPFWCGVFDDKEMLESAIDTLIQEMVDQPLPIKYSAKKHPERELFIPRIFTPNYQGDTIWPQTGMAYISLVKTVYVGLAMQYLGAYTKLIKHYSNFLELYEDNNASEEVPPVPYSGRFGLYTADEGMIWAAMYLDLVYQGGD